MLGFSTLKIIGLSLSMFSPNYWPFVTGRFIIGMAVSGTFLPSFVLGNTSCMRHFTPLRSVLREAQIIIIIIIIIIIRNLYSAIMPLGGYRGAGGTGR